MKNNHTMNTRGFVLIYTVVIVGVIGIIVGIAVNSVLTETRIARDEGESLKAFYAADTGIECVRFLQSTHKAFNTTTAEDTYNCGLGANFTAGFNPPTAECVATTYNFTIDGFSNGACAIVEVTVTPVSVIIGGIPRDVCRLKVFSNGRNSCSASGDKLIERTRWKNL